VKDSCCACRKNGGARSGGLSSKKSRWYQRDVEVLLLVWKQPTTVGAEASPMKITVTSGLTAISKGVTLATGLGKQCKSSSLNVVHRHTRMNVAATFSNEDLRPSLRTTASRSTASSLTRHRDGRSISEPRSMGMSASPSVESR
jgi:hypothetical protein